MDLDTTIKGFELTHDTIRSIFEEICKIEVEDDVTFSVNRTTDIRETDDYPGIRISLTSSYFPLKVPMTVDVTTGDKITPREIEYTFRLSNDMKALLPISATTPECRISGQTVRRNSITHKA